MRTGAREHRSLKLAYRVTLAMLVLATAFPIALMVFNPTLMFERGWEQYVGTAIYFWAVGTLARELRRLWSDEKAFDEAPALLDRLHSPAKGGALDEAVPAAETRVLPGRIRQLATYLKESRRPSVGQLMEVNREGSALDQEHAAGRFTLTRYILYLLPVIGFIGTVEGISRALMNISRVLPMVKNLDGFMSNLTSVTSALQIAFDSTLLALFLSAALMLVQTLVYRRAEDLLARVDRWVVEHVLTRFGADDAVGVGGGAAAAAELDRMRRELATVLQQFAATVERLPASLAGFQRGAESIGRIGSNLEALGTASETLRRGVAGIGRIESIVESLGSPSESLLEIRRGIDRNNAALEALASSMAHAYEKSNRASQEQLARTLHSLKDALDLLHVSMEQGNALYRNIVKKLFQTGDARVFNAQDEAA
jgi:biopolymer transport protein ExbB/TolQ